MMVLPLLIIVLLPKVVNTNDPEMRKVNEKKKMAFFAVMLTLNCMITQRKNDYKYFF